MGCKIKITPSALIDLKETISYYNKQQLGLGMKFKDEILIIFKQLEKVPTSGSFMYDLVRFRVLKRFPFIILYEIIEPKTIAILRIFNSNQKPFWKV